MNTASLPQGKYIDTRLSIDGRWLFSILKTTPEKLIRSELSTTGINPQAIVSVPLPSWLRHSEISVDREAQTIAVCGVDIPRSREAGEEIALGSMVVLNGNLETVLELRENDLRECKVSADGNYILAGGESRYWLYNRQGQALAEFLSCRGEGFPLINLSSDASVVQVDCNLYERDGREIVSLREYRLEAGFPDYTGAMSENGRFAFLSSYWAPHGKPSYSRILLYDLANRTIVWEKQVSGGAGDMPVVASDGTVAYIHNRTLVVVNPDGTLRWQDPSRPGFRHSLPLLSPDEQLLYAGAKLKDKKFAIFDFQTGTRLVELEKDTPSTVPTFSGNRLAWGLESGGIVVYDLVPATPEPPSGTDAEKTSPLSFK